MSFILDALRKSETERQQQSSAEFAGVPTSSGPAGMPRWLWALGLLLLINLVVLLSLLLKPTGEPAPLPVAPVSEVRHPAQGGPGTGAANSDEPSFAEKIAEAKQAGPASRGYTPDRAEASAPEPIVASAPEIPLPFSDSSALPTVYEVIADGTLELPELHLDIHVYSDVPKDRFVFVNMSKHREKSQLAEGPVVKEITPEGVVLEHRGTSFLLPRD
jgi:general secretion pathway protein B